ncbi:hypothetical protein WJX72_007676 [[Myrmecia] bisecta]|uniref:Protein arginine methyltransferase NDUFAF7 n=1 Tax=[Myrmecia] bisecta TaxID=41462 RepID=A0AAW1R801_9CHLO
MLQRLKRSVWLAFGSTSGARCHSTGAAHAQLLREYIHDRLYSSSEGYFNLAALPVGVLAEPIAFNRLGSQQDYQRHVGQLYGQLQGHWLTPSETFRPYYGHAVARYMVAQRAPSTSDDPLNIFEVGGGSGRLAADILDYLRTHHPSLYEKTRYTCIEISPGLARVQRHVVEVGAGHGAPQFRSVEGDASKRSTWPRRTLQRCWVVAMEVLDNLPHDRVLEYGSGQWQMTVVEPGKHATLKVPSQGMRPLDDRLVEDCLAVWQDQQASLASSFAQRLRSLLSNKGPWLRGGDVFLPTGSLQLLETLCDAVPYHNLILADFDELPDVTIPGTSAPLVASKMVGGQTQDHPHYLLPPNIKADILFPTDFELLSRLHRNAARRVLGHNFAVCGQHHRSSVFFRQHADTAATRCQDGYNPLLDDFSNTAIYLASVTGTVQ